MSEKPETQTAVPSVAATLSGPSENEILASINLDHKPSVEQPDVVDHKNERDFVIPEKVHKPHKDLLDKGVHPRDIPHIAYGYMRGCQCLSCKTKRGEMLVKNGSAVVSSSAVPNAEEALIDEIIDAEVAGIIADIPRNLCELMATQKLPAHTKELEKIWQRTVKEQDILNKMAKRVWDKEGNLPDFKHKEAWILGIFEGTKLSVRITATIALIKSNKATK